MTKEKTIYELVKDRLYGDSTNVYIAQEIIERSVEPKSDWFVFRSTFYVAPADLPISSAQDLNLFMMGLTIPDCQPQGLCLAQTTMSKDEIKLGYFYYEENLGRFTFVHETSIQENFPGSLAITDYHPINDRKVEKHYDLNGVTKVSVFPNRYHADQAASFNQSPTGDYQIRRLQSYYQAGK